MANSCGSIRGEWAPQLSTLWPILAESVQSSDDLRRTASLGKAANRIESMVSFGTKLTCLVLPLLAASPEEQGQEASAVLAEHRRALAAGDDEAFFANFSDDAIIMGTAATERFELDECRAWLAPMFAHGPPHATNKRFDASDDVTSVRKQTLSGVCCETLKRVRDEEGAIGHPTAYRHLEATWVGGALSKMKMSSMATSNTRATS
jgi:hypothetical protein